jgi:hypothetical protein
VDHLSHGGQIGHDKLVGQLALVDHLYGDPVLVQPYGPDLFSVNNHQFILF